MKRAGKTIECFNDIRKYLFEHKVPALTFIRDGKTEILYTQMYVDEKDKEIERLNNKIKEQNLLLIEFQDMEQKVDIYKSRCEKAIKYIKSTIFYGMRSGKTLLQKFLYELLNILNGSDENEN